MVNQKCIFCNGKGVIPHFHHIEKGRCFRCNGTGKMDLSSFDNNKVACYCGKKHFQTGDECTSIELDCEQFQDYHYVYFHNDYCSNKYILDNGIDGMYLTNTRF